MRRKMLLSYFSILLAFCAVIFVFVLRTVYSMVQGNLIETSSQIMQRWSTELSDAMGFAHSHILNLASSQHLQELLAAYGTGAAQGDAEQALLRDEALTSLLSFNSVTLGTLPLLVEITARTPDGSYLPVYDTLGLEESPLLTIPVRNGSRPWSPWTAVFCGIPTTTATMNTSGPPRSSTTTGIFPTFWAPYRWSSTMST